MARFYLSAFADEAGDSLDEQIAALKGNGIGFIEPRNIGGKGILDLPDEELFDVRRKLDAAGIRVGSLGSPIGKYDIHADFAPHLEKFRRALRVAEILGTKRIRMFSFFVGQEELAACRDEVIARLSVLTREAKDAGILLCHENESKIYGQMPGEVADLLASLPDLYAIFDPANYRMNGADPMTGIGATLRRLGYLHIKDAIFEEQKIVPAGEGEGKIAEVLGIVDGFTDAPVMLTLEPHLHVFSAYKSIDEHELKGNYTFADNRSAFDFAANALQKLLRVCGFERNGNNEWTR